MLLPFVLDLVLFGLIFETPIKTEEALAQRIIFYKKWKDPYHRKIHQCRDFSPVSPLQFHGSTTCRDAT